MSEFKVTSKAVRELLDNAEFCKEYEIVEDSDEDLFVSLTDFDEENIELLSRGSSKDGLCISYRCLSLFSEYVTNELIRRWNDKNVIINLRKTTFNGEEWLVLTRALFVGYGVSPETIKFEIASIIYSGIPELRKLRLKIAQELGELG